MIVVQVKRIILSLEPRPCICVVIIMILRGEESSRNFIKIGKKSKKEN